MVKRPLLYEGGIPDWVKEEMLSHLPAKPTSEYWSRGLLGDIEDVQIDLLAVLPGRLVGLRMKTVREPMGLPSHAEYSIEVHGKATTAIESVGGTHQYLMFPDDDREARRSVEVTVTMKEDLALGPWKSPITLPMARDDYDRNAEAAGRAALDFRKALIAVLQ